MLTTAPAQSSNEKKMNDNERLLPDQYHSEEGLRRIHRVMDSLDTPLQTNTPLASTMEGGGVVGQPGSRGMPVQHPPQTVQVGGGGGDYLLTQHNQTMQVQQQRDNMLRMVLGGICKVIPGGGAPGHAAHYASGNSACPRPRRLRQPQHGQRPLVAHGAIACRRTAIERRPEPSA